MTTQIVSFTVDKHVVEKLNKVQSQYPVSRSKLVTEFIRKGLDTLEKAKVLQINRTS